MKPHLSLLGPPTLTLKGKVVELSQRKAVALVAYLATRREPVERSVLAGLLWEGDEEAARRNLRQELFRLKGSVFEPLLKQTPQTLALGEVDTDLEAFLGHLTRGEWAKAAGIWRGGFLCGFEVRGGEAFLDWLLPEQERWQGLYREAMLGWARSREAAGAYHEAIEIYRRLLEADPYQEQEQQAVIRLYALLGETPAALRQYEGYREVLRREFGVEPSPETQALYRRLRQGKPLTEAEGFSLPRALNEPPLVGRAEDWMWLEANLCSGVLLLVTGEPGVGKSRLTQEFSRRRGRTLVVRQRESGRRLGFSGFIEAVRVALEQGWDPAGMEAAWRDELAWLVPELAGSLEASFRRERQEGWLREAGRVRFKTRPSRSAKSHLFEALARFVQNWVGPGGILLWEDVHWADESSLEFLPYLVQRSGGLGYMVLATARPEERHPAQLRAVLQELKAEQALRVRVLRNLEVAEVLELIRHLSGQESGGSLFSERLHKSTGGNPFFLLETLRFLFEQGLLRVGEGSWRTPYDAFTADYHELPVPPSVQGAVLSRFQHLTEGTSPMREQALRIAQALALADQPLSLEALRDLLREGSPADNALLAALDQLVQAGLVRAGSDSPGGVRFSLSHELSRQAILAAMPETTRMGFHARFVELLRISGAPPERLALHLHLAGRPREAAQAYLQAARAARSGPLATQALSYYAEARSLLGENLSPADSFALLAEIAELKLILGENPRREVHQMEPLAAELGKAAQYRLRLLEANAAVLSGVVEEGILSARQALELAETPLERGRALFRLAWLEYRGGDPDAQLEPLEQAIQAFHEAGERGLEAQAVRNLSGYWLRLGQLEAFEAAYGEALRLAEATQDRYLLRRLMADRANVDWVKGRYGQSLAAGERLLAEARQTGDLWAVWDALQVQALNASVLGLDEGLEQALQDSLREAEAAGAWRDRAVLRSDLGAGLMAINRLAEAREHLSIALRELQELGERARLGHTLFALGWTLLDSGEPELAEAYLSEAADLWGERKEWRHRARSLAALALARLRYGNRAKAREAAQEAMRYLEDWAKGLFDLPLVLYAYARALGDHEGRPYLIHSQRGIHELAAALEPTLRERLLANRFVAHALGK
ncbi:MULTISPECIES: BTAD domain-containing putative transcriptional regulator [unclassified Meiothermus]|uniref:ATP-binding protein n=1 Tax=unclassified Meiothermus TaxID=370471 RepID=UPI000D7CC250|nr:MULTISPECIES: BTAD domain-containing putative transcriptional regulator [unclassified Meiothermus]PZA08239.1 SARP family transcriptional regulator [Meiothermus sp. Pnk-1]RYM38981.1 SARP family transcriptional regulator [Meiothermus sp. PNK-Is4]